MNNANAVRSVVCTSLSLEGLFLLQNIWVFEHCQNSTRGITRFLCTKIGFFLRDTILASDRYNKGRKLCSKVVFHYVLHGSLPYMVLLPYLGIRNRNNLTSIKDHTFANSDSTRKGEMK